MNVYASGNKRSVAAVLGDQQVSEKKIKQFWLEDEVSFFVGRKLQEYYVLWDRPMSWHLEDRERKTTSLLLFNQFESISQELSASLLAFDKPIPRSNMDEIAEKVDEVIVCLEKDRLDSSNDKLWSCVYEIFQAEHE